MEKEDALPAKKARLSSSKDLVQESRTENKSIWLPTECWVDTLKLLSRRQLLRGVQPACRRLHAIAELPDVPSMHIVRNLNRFFNDYMHNRSEANRQYAELAASQAELTRHIRLGTTLEFRMDICNNKNECIFECIETAIKGKLMFFAIAHRTACTILRLQFRKLAKMQLAIPELILQIGYNIDSQNGPQSLKLAKMQSAIPKARRHQAQLCMLRHSSELFRNCTLYLVMSRRKMIEEYLSLVGPTRPFHIRVTFVADGGGPPAGLQPDKVMREPLMLACPKLAFHIRQYNMARYGPSAETICHWLHHLPTTDQMEEKNKKENSEQNWTQTRIFTLTTDILPNTTVEIIERCKQSLQKAESESDRRTFLLNFQQSTVPSLFKLENNASGEVLQLKAHRSGCYTGSTVYYLRRCPAAELANADKFFRDTFRGLTLDFRTPLKNGMELPTLMLI